MKTDGISVKKNSWLIVAVSIALWFFSLLNGTGIGNTYKVYDKSMFVVLFCYVYQMLVKGRFRKIKKSTIIVLFTLLLQNLYTNLMYGNNFIEYLEIYAIPILYSLFTVNEDQMRKIGLIYGIGGGIILLVANYTKVFAGWDGNSVSMICFFSYTVFIASLFDVKKKEHQQRIIIYSLFYFILLWTLNSRSCMFFSAFLLLCELDIIPARIVIEKNTILWWLLVPLIIALIIISINSASFVESLNQWSQSHFHKSMFNGRDDMWVEGFRQIIKHPIFGTGSFTFRWHNSAVSCLVGAGVVGYFIWIYAIRAILVKACKYKSDNIIFGAVTAFLAVWLQQSVEIGIISTRGNPVIFVLLGLILARTNTLDKEEETGG